MLGSSELPAALASDYATAALDAPDRAMLDYAVKLTRTPQEVQAADIARLKDAGFDDAAVLDICQVTSYYNYVNRLADGLGVELEDGWQPEHLTLDRDAFERRRAARRTGRGRSPDAAPRGPVEEERS